MSAIEKCSSAVCEGHGIASSSHQQLKVALLAFYHLVQLNSRAKVLLLRARGSPTPPHGAGACPPLQCWLLGCRQRDIQHWGFPSGCQIKSFNKTNQLHQHNTWAKLRGPHFLSPWAFLLLLLTPADCKQGSHLSSHTHQVRRGKAFPSQSEEAGLEIDLANKAVPTLQGPHQVHGEAQRGRKLSTSQFLSLYN